MSASLSYRRGMRRDAVLVRYGRTPAQGKDDSLQEVDVDIAPLIMRQVHWLVHGHFWHYGVMFQHLSHLMLRVSIFTVTCN
jgi:hypothetical protein